MKLKDVKGLLGEKKNDNDKDNGVVFKFGYNQAHDEIGEKEIELDKEKIEEMILDCVFELLPHHFYETKIRDLAQAIAKADIIKVKEVR